MSQLPLKAWVLLDGDDIATHDGRLPLFWYRDVAKLKNLEWLGGTGRIVRVEVQQVYKRKRIKE